MNTALILLFVAFVSAPAVVWVMGQLRARSSAGFNGSSIPVRGEMSLTQMVEAPRVAMGVRGARVRPRSTLSVKLYRAGYRSANAEKIFRMIQGGLVLVIGGAAIWFFNSNEVILGTVLGLIVGISLGVILPSWSLDRTVARIDEDILYFLPLVIEQLVVGVKSGLDVGPCIQRVVAMADERESHNRVTQLLREALFMSKSGMSLDVALDDVGTHSGHTELKHAFLTLGQVCRHGGEISRQLQELATAVTRQREVLVEHRIKKLELHATGPVAVVFFSFMIVLLTGIGLQVLKAFS